MSNLSYLINKATKTAFKKKGFVSAEIITEWALIINDEKLAKYSTPIKVSFPPGQNKNGTVYIETVSALAMEIKQKESMILEKIASYFGYRAVERLKIIHKSEFDG